MLPEARLDSLLHAIRSGTYTTWNDVHAFYLSNTNEYKQQKLGHALASLHEVMAWKEQGLKGEAFSSVIDQSLATKAWMTENIYASRAKDYESSFRQMVYNNKEEMEEVIGKLEENVFIAQQREELEVLKDKLERVKNKLGL